MAVDTTSLAEYALGLLDRHAREQVENALEHSANLKRELHAIEGLLGELGQIPAPVTASPALGERLLASLETRTRFEAFTARLGRLLDLDEEPVDKLLDAIDAFPHHPWIARKIAGVYQLPFDPGPRLSGAECALTALEPQTVFPPHRHRGHEWGFVLQGRVFRITERGEDLFVPGDIVHNPPASVHSFAVAGDTTLMWVLVSYGGIELLP